MSIREALLATHLLGLCLAFLTAVGMDLRLLGFSLGLGEQGLERSAFQQASLRIRTGFGLLVVSGLGFLWFDQLGDGAVGASPKLIAKLLIIGVAGANGYWMERFLVPEVLESPGAGLRRKLTIASCLSLVSWTSATWLGTSRSLNASASVGGVVAVYGAVFCTVTLSILMVGSLRSAYASAAHESRSYRPADAR
jgi:hypothetical protein